MINLCCRYEAPISQMTCQICRSCFEAYKIHQFVVTNSAVWSMEKCDSLNRDQYVFFNCKKFSQLIGIEVLRFQFLFPGNAHSNLMTLQFFWYAGGARWRNMAKHLPASSRIFFSFICCSSSSRTFLGR